jgi:arylsulfatase A-like enzyme
MVKMQLHLFPFIAAAAAVNLQQTCSETVVNRPNVVFILTDNQGAWSLGCYGNRDILTPNIDRLAAEGIRFTRAMSCNPVSSPTRATFLTGLIPSQHGVHCYIDNKHMLGPEAHRMIDEFTSLGEILHDSGYICGLSGKWHLGDHMNAQEGFSFWVTKPGGHTLEFYNQDVIEDGRIHNEAGYTTDFWTKKGIQFIRENKDHPFFLLLAYNGPYALGDLMLNPPRNRFASYYKDKQFICFPSDAMHPWQYQNKTFHNTQTAKERLAAETSGVDDGVGEIMSELKRLGLDENTIVIYAADQGYMGGQNGMWGMGDHFRPVGAHELMMNIPLIFRHPGKIPAGLSSDIIVSNYDFLPTILAYLRLDTKIPEKPELPGHDFSPFLHGNTTAWVNECFYEMENTRAIRTDDWKYVARFPEGPFELYSMKQDPRERFNLYGQPGTETALSGLKTRMDEFFMKYADPKYNIWQGGGSKASRLTK